MGFDFFLLVHDTFLMTYAHHVFEEKLRANRGEIKTH
jgi:hypothetical protein